MRIAYLSASSIPSRTANSVHVMKMCQAFARLGHEVTLHAFKGNEPVDDVFAFYDVTPGFRLAFPPRIGLPGIATKLRLHVLLRPLDILIGYLTVRSRSFDLIYGRNIYWLAGAALCGIPLAIELHAPPKTMIHGWLARFIFARAGFAGLVVISSALKRICLQRFACLSEAQVLVAHDGADQPDPTEDATSSDACDLTVGYVGHLYPGRGIEVIIGLAERFKDIRFRIIGGQEADIACYRSRGGGGKLEFVGFVPPADLKDHYPCLDIVLAPYQRDVQTHAGERTADYMSPLKLFEYMAWRKAIIASDLPVIGEVLRHRENALLVDPDNLDLWAEALTELGRDEDQRERLAGQAQRDFLADYTWNARAEKVLAFAAGTCRRR